MKTKLNDHERKGERKMKLKIIINKEILRVLKVPVSPLPFQNKFADIVKKVESIKLKHEESLKELENLYGSLSQRAFRGELEFGDDTNEI